ncbi:MAG: hypothetical protein HOL31_10350 [Candidatus Scalindua sp.]|nr:hypothetical protein [Candidatus Scalindua sp.]MBT6048283.1 hypothetical protein [Candidatus Scalindua sp.]
MNDDQKEAFREYYMLVLQTRITSMQRYSDQVLRFLLLGNGAGILLLATFMGNLAGNNKDFSMMVNPLMAFVFGLLLAALVFIPLIYIANKSVNKISNQSIDFFFNHSSTCNLRDYIVKPFLRIVVMGLFIISAIMFFLGVYQSFTILKQI